MKLRNFLLSGVVLLLAALSFAQSNTLVATTLSAAVTTTTGNTLSVTSATGITGGTASHPTVLYIDRELMSVRSVTGTTIIVVRGQPGSQTSTHASGALVLIGAPSLFYSYDPAGSCTAANTLVSPWVNVTTGNQWLCSSVTGTWVAGFNNDLVPPEATAAVASAAGLVTPSGPLFHITGALAITGFNIPVGFSKGMICAIPDGTFTTTTANNIALASTAVVSKTLCWTYDGKAAKPFFPAY